MIIITNNDNKLFHSSKWQTKQSKALKTPNLWLFKIIIIIIKTEENAGTYWNEKEKTTQVKQTIQLEEINQKGLAKGGRLKRYRDRIKTIQTKYWTLQNNEKKFTCTNTYQQPLTRKQNNFRVKYGNEENVTQKPNG